MWVGSSPANSSNPSPATPSKVIPAPLLTRPAANRAPKSSFLKLIQQPASHLSVWMLPFRVGTKLGQAHPTTPVQLVWDPTHTQTHTPSGRPVRPPFQFWVWVGPSPDLRLRITAPHPSVHERQKCVLDSIACSSTSPAQYFWASLNDVPAAKLPHPTLLQLVWDPTHTQTHQCSPNCPNARKSASKAPNLPSGRHCPCALLPELPKRAKSAPKIITSERKKRQF